MHHDKQTAGVFLLKYPTVVKKLRRGKNKRTRLVRWDAGTVSMRLVLSVLALFLVLVTVRFLGSVTQYAASGGSSSNNSTQMFTVQNPQQLASSYFGPAEAERLREYTWRAILAQNAFLTLSAWNPVHTFPLSRVCPAKGELASAQISGLGLQDAGWPMQGNGAQ